MNLLRQYVRGILLKEGAKGPNDLPDDTLIVIDGDPSRGQVIIYISVDDEAAGYPELGEMDGLHGSIRISNTPDAFGACDGAMVVDYSTATHGYGPLLYDIAIEYATIHANGLIPDRRSVSDSAKHVWTTYQRERYNDVRTHQLDDPFDKLTPTPKDNCDQEVSGYWDGADWTASPLSQRYTKSPPATINHLQRIGKLVYI